MTTAAANIGMTEQLAQWICAQTFDSLPAAVRAKTGTSFLNRLRA